MARVDGCCERCLAHALPLAHQIHTPMKTLLLLLPTLLLCFMGCSDAPTATDSQSEAIDTTALQLEQAKQDIEDAGKELDELINDL